MSGPQPDSKQSDMADIELQENKNTQHQGLPVAITKQSFLGKLLEKSTMWKALDGDKLHVVILFFLYCLQGIPLGLRDAIPLILTSKNIPYTDQATFSISSYPFSMKVNFFILRNLQCNGHTFYCLVFPRILRNTFYSSSFTLL